MPKVFVHYTYGTEDIGIFAIRRPSVRLERICNVEPDAVSEPTLSCQSIGFLDSRCGDVESGSVQVLIAFARVKHELPCAAT
jgi:hypothetical protein